MLSAELIKKIDSLFIRSRHRVTDVFSGEYESAFRGRGIEFEEFREYVPGDDIRQIDWHVTARMDKPFVKIYREEREQTIFFLVDSSRSLKFGQKREKLEVATELAALLSYAAIKSHDKVGLIIFSDQIEKYIAPKQGRAHVWNIIATLLTHKPRGTKTDINQATQFFLNVTRRKTVCFLISDFLDVDCRDSLRVASFKHEFVVMRVLDTLERQLPQLALMDFVDLESGQNKTLDLGGNNTWFGDGYRQTTKDLTRFLGNNNIDFLDLRADEDYVEALLKFFMKKDKKR
ncbi:MAG: hypothetical protein ACD_62C00335G0004 [uncultured bacterium]|nr:MAG: hypothetical protein ACD_62C00335G0004 [uncultured bacterium]